MKSFIPLAVAAIVALTSFRGFSQSNEVAPGVLQVGEIQNPAVAESSGIIPSRRTRGAFWTHNDSGLDMIYAMRGDGRALGEWKIKGVEMQNIEDIASSPGRLYLADIGNNDRTREEVWVYSLPEPLATRSGVVRPNRAWRLRFPGDPFERRTGLQRC